MTSATDYERAALASLEAVASSASASPAARVAAARAILEHLRPSGVAASPPAGNAPPKSPQQLSEELAQLRARRAVQVLK